MHLTVVFSIRLVCGYRVAHDLAKLAMTIPNCVIWMEDIPSEVVNSYQADLAEFS